MILSDVPLKAQTLSGKIKAADERIEKTGALVEERRAALNRAHDDHNAAIEEAWDLRIERDLMAAEAALLIGQVGEPPVAAGEEVSISADVGGAGLPPPASCEHNNVHWSDHANAFVCTFCAQELNDNAIGISAVRRVALGG